MSKAAAIRDYLDLLAPHRRIAALLAFIKNEPAEIFWPCFIHSWTDCDKGSANPLLLKELRRVGPFPASYYLEHDPDRGEFFRSLPDQITVYRGAARQRIAGLSWTTSQTVAWSFGYGHRGIPVPDPVVATGTISKSDVFWATDWRNEKEILGGPRDIKIENFPREKFRAYIGSLIVNSILNDRHRSAWSDKEYAAAGLQNVHPITIARAHAMAVENMPPMEAPTNYWAAVLAAVPEATLATAAEVNRARWEDLQEQLADQHICSVNDDDE